MMTVPISLISLISLLLAIIVSTLSYKAIHLSRHHHHRRHQHHQYNVKNHDSIDQYKKSTMAYVAKADEVFERRNKTEIFNLAYSDETLDECSLEGECSDTPKAWSGQKGNTNNSNNSNNSKSTDKNQQTPIWLSDDDNENKNTPKGKAFIIN